MRVLIAYGTKMGGTAGIAETLGQTLTDEGFDVDVRAARQTASVAGYDAVIVGGALYAFRWHRDARRFARRFRKELSTKPVWLFSSGPLDDSATESDIPPVRAVEKAMRRIGARGHKTFGGRIPADAKGFPASVMARDNAGDWRDPADIARWAHKIAVALQPPDRATVRSDGEVVR